MNSASPSTSLLHTATLMLILSACGKDPVISPTPEPPPSVTSGGRVWSMPSSSARPFALTYARPSVRLETNVDQIRIGAMMVEAVWDSVNQALRFVTPPLPEGRYTFTVIGGGRDVGEGRLSVGSMPAGELPEKVVSAFIARYDRALTSYLTNASAATRAAIQSGDEELVAWNAPIDSVVLPLIESYRQGVRLWATLPPAARDTVGFLLAANAGLVDTLLSEIDSAATEIDPTMSRIAPSFAVSAASQHLTPRSMIGRCETTLDKIRDASAANNWWARHTGLAPFMGQGLALSNLSKAGRMFGVPLFIFGTGMSAAIAIADARLAYSRYDEALVPRVDGGSLALTFSKSGASIGGKATIGAVVVLEPIGNSVSDVTVAATSVLAAFLGVHNMLSKFANGYLQPLRVHQLTLLVQGVAPWLLQPEVINWAQQTLDYEKRFGNWKMRSDKRRVIKVDPDLVSFTPWSAKEWSIQSGSDLQISVTANPDQSYWQFFTPQTMTSTRAGEPGYDVCNLTPATPTITGTPLLNAFRIERAPDRITLGGVTLTSFAEGQRREAGIFLRNSGTFTTDVEVKIAPEFSAPGGVTVGIDRGKATLAPKSGAADDPLLQAVVLPGARSQSIRVPVIATGRDGRTLACALSTVRIIAAGSTGKQSTDGQLTLTASGGSGDPRHPDEIQIVLGGQVVQTLSVPGVSTAKLALHPGYNQLYYLVKTAPKTGSPVTLDISGFLNDSGQPASERVTVQFTSTSGRNFFGVAYFKWPAVSDASNEQWDAYCERGLAAPADISR